MAYSNNFNGNNEGSYESRRPYKKNFQRPANVVKTLTLGQSDKYSKNLQDMADLIKKIPFDKISIPVTITKAEAFGNDEARGFITVGYVNSFDLGKFNVTILNKFADKVPDGRVVVPKVRTTREGVPTFISAFAIEDGAPANVSSIKDTTCDCSCESCDCEKETDI